MWLPRWWSSRKETLVATSRRKARRHLQLEQLESRCTPAAIVNPQMLQYTDVDGDPVHLSVSGGARTPNDFVFAPAGVGEQLQTINLGSEGGGDGEPGPAPLGSYAGSQFAGADIAVRVIKRARGGDGLANVGF